MFIPRTEVRYHEYAPLYHLIPRAKLERFGIPSLKPGTWPPYRRDDTPPGFLPSDFSERLSRAWSSIIWRYIMPQTPLGGFSSTDSIKILSHSLDFWIPPATEVIEERLREFPLLFEGPFLDSPARFIDGSTLDGASFGSPRLSGPVWAGEVCASKVAAQIAEKANADGRLKGILDAIRSNRVEEDFSPHWSYAREDFERKLYRKRSRIKVRFVELTDSVIVQSPETEVVDQLVLGDFLSILNERERELVVLLYSGETRIGEISKIMGYKGHSTASRRLDKIRRKAQKFFTETA
ncbi:hypothetical protein ABZV91_18850 [Nocardia sp. NPDC004568]|uniref:hypothetical protein n=1 Tax=Nocardia sp. NPDC004568 TaxID=3154551 RepID=UPI0033B0DB93